MLLNPPPRMSQGMHLMLMQTILFYLETRSWFWTMQPGLMDQAHKSLMPLHAFKRSLHTFPTLRRPANVRR